MNQIKMQVLLGRVAPLNRWDKDSIRPGPVGSVGDVNLQVKLKKSSPDMANRYEKAFSGPNEVWSGSNVSDGQWTGYTSGGRGAITLTQPLPPRAGFRTPVGWMFENVMPVDRTRDVKTVPLGQYGWETTTANVLKAKVTGEQFLPLPLGYTKPELPRGSHFPRIVATSIGEGIALPAADVPITDPEFGENGYIEDDNAISIPTTGGQVGGCRPEDVAANKNSYYVPRMGDKKARAQAPPDTYPYRLALDPLGKGPAVYQNNWPNVGTPEYIAIRGKWWGWKAVQNTDKITFHPCGSLEAPEGIFNPPDAPARKLPPTKRPKPGDNRVGKAPEKEPIGRPQKKIKV